MYVDEIVRFEFQVEITEKPPDLQIMNCPPIVELGDKFDCFITGLSNWTQNLRATFDFISSTYNETVDYCIPGKL